VKALITGAAGFIGSHLTTTLLDRGADVVGLDCFTDYYARSVKEANLDVNRRRRGFQFVEDRLQDANLTALLDGVSHVFHLAAQAGVRRSWGRDFRLYTDNNVDASQQLLEACVGRPLHRVVYASSSSLYGDGVPIPMREDALPRPVSPYGVTKLAAEHLCELYRTNFGLPTVSLRFFTVYGPRQRPDMAFSRLISAGVRGELFELYGTGEQTRDFTYVGDIVRALRDAAVSDFTGVANIGGGSRTSMNEVLEIVAAVAGEPIVRRLAKQQGDVRDTAADTRRAREGFGYVPQVDLREGLAAMAEAERSALAMTEANN
jgi:nucleoside-diphosphate-sugar epimerase